MIKSESRKSNLFSSLKSRRSLKDLTARVHRTSSLISGPFSASTSELVISGPQLQTQNSNSSVLSSPLSPLDLNVPPSGLSSHTNKRHSKMYFPVADGPENYQYSSKRHSYAYKARSSSPSSDITLATISAVPSDMTSVESNSIDLPAPTIREHDDDFDSPEHRDDTHLWYTDYASSLDKLDMEYAKSETREPQPEPEISAPALIHRTSNLGDIRQFLGSADMLPMSNRKSLDFEARELQLHRSRLCPVGGEDQDCVVKLVENAFVMSFFPDTETRFWDEIDIEDTLKGDYDDSLREFMVC